ncbi:hypothetical protein MRB53_013624 [Persea americana]|uniref:Uncharacterized protein n=1 Tax=Persea americana TaxID=3435 RepID=A0ACC2K8H5_PERAE|nr:hypothetical protein MRB53_013624 [Persea americana]
MIRTSDPPTIYKIVSATATDVNYGPYIFGSLVGTVPEVFLTIYRRCNLSIDISSSLDYRRKPRDGVSSASAFYDARSFIFRSLMSNLSGLSTAVGANPNPNNPQLILFPAFASVLKAISLWLLPRIIRCDARRYSRQEAVYQKQRYPMTNQFYALLGKMMAQLYSQEGAISKLK